MRKSPKTLRYLARCYAIALMRLRVDAIVEVPEAVSPLAGCISAMTNLPIITVREEAKEGRVVKGRVVGELKPGMRVAVIDDVITDGASKLAALRELRAASVDIAGMVVLVDRQQGWKEKLANAGFGNVGVWPAMTLHDVRRYLIVNGLMQRCDPTIEEKNPIIVALDGKSWDEVLPLIDQLRTTGCILKVNDLLLNDGIANFLPELEVYGRVMADLKIHDIPNTGANICSRLRVCPPWAVTVHASGGPEMMRKVKDKLIDTPTKVLAVTVLTSLDDDFCRSVFGRVAQDQVAKFAQIAFDAGVDGFVCSPKEVAALKQTFPHLIFVTPGVRSPGQDQQDQARVDTPKGAIKNGASHLVMGRQILGAKYPIAEVHRVLSEELGITVEQ